MLLNDERLTSQMWITLKISINWKIGTVWLNSFSLYIMDAKTVCTPLQISHFQLCTAYQEILWVLHHHRGIPPSDFPWVTSIHFTSYPTTLRSFLILHWGELLSFEFPTNIYALLIWPPVLRYLNVYYLNIFIVSELKVVNYIYWLFHLLYHVTWEKPCNETLKRYKKSCIFCHKQLQIGTEIQTVQIQEYRLISTKIYITLKILKNYWSFWFSKYVKNDQNQNQKYKMVHTTWHLYSLHG